MIPRLLPAHGNCRDLGWNWSLLCAVCALGPWVHKGPDFTPSPLRFILDNLHNINCSIPSCGQEHSAVSSQHPMITVFWDGWKSEGKR